MPQASDLAKRSGAGRRLIAAQQFWRLAPRELDRLLALTRQADRIELKIVVPPAAHRSTYEALGVDLSRAQSRKVYFLETPDRLLEKHGIVVRIRSVENRPDDSVVKLRPVSPGRLPSRLRRSKRFVVEVDAMPGTFVCTGAILRRLGRLDVERSVSTGRPLRALFSKEQRDLLAAHTPDRLTIDDLTLFGPVDVRRRKIRPGGKGRVLTVEQWTYPDGSRILELSTRCPAKAAVRVTADLAALLRAHGVGVTTDVQQTKTGATLAYFGSTGVRRASGRH